MATNDRLKAILTGLFAGGVVIANVLAAKLTWIVLPGLGGVAVPAGFAAFGVAYLCSDLIVEFYGEDTAHEVVNGTIITLVAAYLLTAAAIWFPAAPFYQLNAEYAAVLGSSASIVLASVVALGIAQHFDVAVFARVLDRTGRRHKWARNCVSTSLSQGVDTVIFVGLGFGVFPLLGLGGSPILGWELVSIIVGQYVVKLGVALADTVPFYLITSAASTPNSSG